MKLIEWINGITKLNKTTMDEFQNNVKEAVDEASQTGGVLEGSVIGWNSDTIPEGYEEVGNPTLEVYSTEETVIGTYLGKPLYRKVITGFTPAANATLIIQLNELIDFKTFTGVMVSPYDDYKWIIGTYYNENIYSSLEHNIVENALYFYGSSSTLNRPCEITIEYTKTND